jgi:hypothetical protein
MAAELILIAGFTTLWAWLNWASGTVTSPVDRAPRHETGMA